MKIFRVLVIASSLLGSGASIAEPPDLANSQAISAFECAALAAHTSNDSPIRSHEARLFAYGYEREKEFFQKMGLQLRNQFKGFGPDDLRSKMPSDFWIGVFWEQTNAGVTEQIERKFPIGTGLPFSDLTAARQNAAMNEFWRRNCQLVGMPAG